MGLRYVINDDDLENWYSRLYRINKIIKNDEIDYILSQLEIEFSQHVPDENMDAFLKLLRRIN